MPLDPRIEAVRDQYGLSRDDFWELPQKRGTWIAKHAALEVAAAKADIRFDNPVIIEANTAEGIAVLSVRGEMGGRFEWSTGEATPKNNKNSYPWAMAEKRAKDRVILKLIGIHGLVYSEDEGDFDPPQNSYGHEAPPPNGQKTQFAGSPPVLPKAKARELYTEMSKELSTCQTVPELEAMWRSPAFSAEFKKLPSDWQGTLIADATDRKRELSGTANLDAIEQGAIQ